MLTAIKAGLVVIGGLLLGTILGEAADPTMTPPPESAWRAAVPAYRGADPQVATVREIVPFAGFTPETDAISAEAWPATPYPWWEDEPLGLDAYYADAAAYYADDRAVAWDDSDYAGYEPVAADPQTENAADDAERAVADAELAAAPVLAPEPLNAEGQPGIW